MWARDTLARGGRDAPGRGEFGRVRARHRERRGRAVGRAMPVVMEAKALISSTEEWRALRSHVEAIDKTHLRDLIRDEARCDALALEYDGLYCDFARQRVTTETMEKLYDLARAAGVREKVNAMFNGEAINSTENRAVLHVATRAPKDKVINVDGRNVVPDVHDVLEKIKEFSERVRNGEWIGETGKPLKDVVAIGIGGSFLGPLFVHTALRTNPEAAVGASGRQLRFLANVDPVDVARSLNGLDPETTLVIVVSKTFTTAETMLNARTVRAWIRASLGENAVQKHMVAISTNLKLVKEFGIDPDNAFAFWDWVGGRYSVCSAVGMLPLSLQYGYDTMEKFLEGAWSMDQHFANAPFEENLPVTLGMLSVWNVSFLGCPARAILPYCQALAKLAPHIQQVAMESNGKGVAIDGTPLDYDTGEIDFGEPGTNGQHSFYQLIHQGRTIPCDFIGIVKSQQSVYLKGEIVSNHDELMCNFFAQADALAVGKSAVELRSENVPDALIPHKTFSGNRPSLSIMLPELNAYTTGQLLSLYEHRVAVQGFVWGINSFDQWGVELGKVLASRVRATMNDKRTKGETMSGGEGYNPSTTRLLNRYLAGKAKLIYPEPKDVFPCDLIDSDECRPPTSYV
ncbi:cytosolic phosphoglucose isomerase [Ostreococcus tauri]|uniref:Glucose-6-phosphate isomerase n=2 Tax=Ostreococcus tauri TaxID=70448 RepID=A0A1Y5ICX4_OSTTA|nr:cytosolic phosphoglucose isomerase [Ostreococcus tauri]